MRPFFEDLFSPRVRFVGLEDFLLEGIRGPAKVGVINSVGGGCHSHPGPMKPPEDAQILRLCPFGQLYVECQFLGHHGISLVEIMLVEHGCKISPTKG